VRDWCKERADLVEAVIAATCRVHETQLQLDAAKVKGISTRKYVAAFYKARVEERRALAALDAHKKEREWLVANNTT
jgi:hypothetical protein